ncbi:MAG: hypothetical protein ACK4PG_03900 [Acetobacteraceae bacterium]
MLGAVPLVLGMMRGGTPPLLLVGDGALGAAAYARTSVAHGFGAAGALFAAASGVARFVGPDGHLLIERQSQNVLANPRLEGGTPGTIGSGAVLPVDMEMTSAGSITRQIVGFGTEDGIPYADMRWAGTQGTNAVGTLVFGVQGGWTCSAGQGFALSLCVRLVGGSLSNIVSVRLRVQERDGASQTVLSPKTIFTPTSAPLRSQRYTDSHTVGGAATNNARLQLSFTPGANTPFDVTFRIGLPQVEPGAAVTSPILPPAGTPGASTRAAGSLLFAPNGGLPAAGTLLLDGLIPVAPGVERRLIAVETSGGASGVALACNAAGTSLSAVPFPSGSAVTGGATSPGARLRAALAWDAGGIAVSVNGGAAAAGAAPPAGLAQVSQGGASAAEALEIRRLELFPQRLSDAALAALTTLP